MLHVRPKTTGTSQSLHLQMGSIAFSGESEVVRVKMLGEHHFFTSTPWDLPARPFDNCRGWSRTTCQTSAAPAYSPGRSTWCVYWCFKEFPEWFRHRELGWLSFGFLRTSIVKKIEGGIAAVFRRMLHMFFRGPGFSFGVGVRCRLGGDVFLVQGIML